MNHQNMIKLVKEMDENQRGTLASKAGVSKSTVYNFWSLGLKMNISRRIYNKIKEAIDAMVKNKPALLDLLDEEMETR